MSELILIPKEQSSLKHAMQPLDAYTFPLTGSSLIEASAGTGKTYTIVNLYLRLLLGHGCQPLGVEKILVVTFTNAATAELRERIRLRLRQAYLDFFASLGGHCPSDDPFIQRLIEQSNNLSEDCQRLALASKQMDEAAVYTIHGFCQKALTEHAFESGALYDQSFILDESEWVQIAVEDYWRKHIVHLPKQVLQLLLKIWPQPDNLLKSIQTFIYREAVVHGPITVDVCKQQIERYQQQVKDVKFWWLSNNVSEALGKANLNGRAKLSKYAFLQKMDSFCKGELLQPDFDKTAWADFSQEKVTKAAKKGSADLSHLDFSKFDILDESLTQCQNAIKVSFSDQAIKIVKANLQSQKHRLQMLSPDDLLLGLKRALTSDSNSDSIKESNALSNALRQTYPAALIDEFQDTDPVQFDVFKGIYAADAPNQSPEQSCWIMIGDPKQAIYGFRGADIFTYIEAKHKIDKKRQFTLAKNWRSSARLVGAINHLFEKSEKGFLFEQDIPFSPVLAGRDFDNPVTPNLDGFKIKGINIPSLHFNHYIDPNNAVLSANDAQPFLAQQTANQICDWLSLAKSNEANINGQSIKAGDCCVLVRTRYEAGLVKDALSMVNVDSVFLSRSSVFDTQIAQDLYRLLKAISQPREEKLLKTALMSELFSFTANRLDDMFNDELAWQNTLEQSFLWHQTWNKQGLMRALNLAFSYFGVEQVLVSQYKDGLRRITNLHHLVELLQQQSLKLLGEAQLIHWFEACLLEPDASSESQQMRLESDSNLVQIITLHASKGLEFPLVFIPFGPSFKNSQNAIYHNDVEQLEVDFLGSDSKVYKAEYERLAEDIRLFYVAVTRAVHYCCIGVWNINLAKSKKLSGFTQSAMGCLLLSKLQPDDAEVNGSISNLHIKQAITHLADNSDVSYGEFEHVVPGELFVNEEQGRNIDLVCESLNSSVQRSWRLTSYSAISRQQVHIDMPTPGLDEGQDHITIDSLDVVDETPASSEVIKSPFTFERGANAGSFLHGVLENIDFQQPEELEAAIQKQSIKFGIDEGWMPCLKNWLRDVLNTPISEHIIEDTAPQTQALLCLSQLSKQQIKVEMEFYMPLHKVQVQDFNQVINQFNPQNTRNYHFDKLNGMIKGYIDLMFEFNGQYYVADYKSNHLGDDYDCYNLVAMEKAMTEHDYHLQAILYTLALHRWLKNRLLNYDYDTHIGGAYYLFIRGMTQTEMLNNAQKKTLPSEKRGVYFIKPQKNLIEDLDALFNGELKARISPMTKLNEANNNNLVKPEGQLDLW